MIFLLMTVFFLIATAAFSSVMWVSIQNDQWLDKVVGWQKMLSRHGSEPGFWNEFVYKALGGCEFCFSHFITVICFVFYCLFMNVTVGWLGIEPLWASIIGNIVWYLVYISTGTMLSFMAITRILGRGRDDK